ncbi:MAG: hypothetical protein ABR606_16405 [Vicinamibacterales bacterium]
MQNFVTRVAMCLGVFVFVLCPAISSAQPPDPIVGAWKLNLTKSKYATPAPKSMTLTVAPAATGYAMTVDAIGPDGKPQKWGFTSRYDGSESPVSGNPAIDAVVARSNGTSGTVQYKKAGKVVVTTTSVLSDDGKSLTATVKMLDAQGQEVTTLAVYDRQ